MRTLGIRPRFAAPSLADPWSAECSITRAARGVVALRSTAAIAALKPAGLLLPAIGLAGVTTLLRGAGMEASLRTLAMGLAAIAILVLPGQLVLHLLGWQRGLVGWEQLPRAFALSTLVMLALASVLMTSGLPLTAGIVAIAGLAVLGLAVLASRPRDATPVAISSVAETWLLIALWSLVAVAASLAGTLMTGEEEYELVTIRKIAENPSLAWDNLMHHPGELTTYLATPHYFQVAAIARIAGGELIGLYSKMRLIDVLLAGAATYAVARSVLGSYRGAFIASLVALVWIVVDPVPNSLIASLLPLTRRGAIAAGLLLPAALAMTMDALRQGGWTRALAVGLLCTVTAMTHALEGAHFFLVAIAGLIVGILTFIGRRESPLLRRAVLVLGAYVLCLGAFRAMHSRVATDVTTYEAPRQAALLQLIHQRLTPPLDAVIGPLLPEGDYVLRQTLPLLPYVLLALVFGAILAPWRRSPYLAIAWAVVCITFLMHLVPLVTLLAMYFTTSEIFLVYGTLTMASVPVIAAGIETAARAAEGVVRRLLPGWVPMATFWCTAVVGAVAVAAGVGLRPALAAFLSLVDHTPWTVSIVAATIFGLALAVRLAARARLAPAGRLSPAVAAVAVVGLCLPLALNLKSLSSPRIYGIDRLTLVEQASLDWKRPDPLDFEHYYPTLATLGLSAENRNALATGTAVAPLIPYDVIRWLRITLPPQRVVLARPERIYTLAELLDEYIAHAGFGLADALDTEYLTSWVPQSAGHPFFGAPPDPEREAEFLRHWGVNYIVVDPDMQLTTGRQLSSQPTRFERLANYGDYTVYRVR